MTGQSKRVRVTWEKEKKEAIVKGWLRLINEFPIEHIARKIVEELESANGSK